jgi:L-asparaginase
MSDPTAAGAESAHVALFALGGTIAAPVDSTGGNAGMTLSADDIVGDLAALAGVTVDATTFRRLPSASLGLDDLVELAAAVQAALVHGAIGAVVTVGTDTLEEVAYLLDLLVPSDAPVVVTGAMRNAGLPGADGPANLLAALRVGVSPQARGIGALVVMDDRIHLARSARKTHSSSTAAFTSTDIGPVGWIVEGRVRIPLVPRHRTIPLPPPTSIPRVGLVRLSVGDDPAVLEAVADLSDGLVVEVMGAGHAPADSMPALRRIAARIPTVAVSRTGAGELYRAVGAFPGSEQDLLAAGVLPGDQLDGPKARILLTLCLGAGLDRDAVAARFAPV